MSDVHWTTSKYYNYVASTNFWVVLFLTLSFSEKWGGNYQPMASGRMGCRSIFMYLWFHETFLSFSHYVIFNKYPVKRRSFKFPSPKVLWFCKLVFRCHNENLHEFGLVFSKNNIWLDALLTPHYKYLCTYNFEFTRQSIIFCKLVNEWKNL